MNDLRDLIIALDGYSIEKTGFAVMEAHKGKSNFWSLTVKAYKKEEACTSEDPVCVLTLVDRIENKYGTHNNKWAVVKVEELEEGTFDLVVKKVEDEKEDCSDKEEHVEDEVDA